MGLRLLSAVVSIVLLHSSGYAMTWHVAPDGSGDAPTIQAAIDLCAAGDVVQLAQGVYTTLDGVGNDPAGHGRGRPVCMALKSNVTVRGNSSNPELFVVDAGGGGGVVFCASVSDVVLEGMTITHGSTHVVWNGSGGGIYCTNSDLTISHCRLVDNASPDHGGALHAYMATVTIENCLIEGNLSAFTGSGAYFSDSSVSVEETVVSNNRVVNGGALPTYTGGAGFYFNSSFLQISQSAFLSNTVDSGGGGGINCYGGNTGTIQSSRFEGNQASWGGALRIWSQSCVNILDCSIHSNEAWEYGGAISTLTGTSFTIRNTDFGENVAPVGAEGFIETGCSVQLQCCVVDPNLWSGIGGWSFNNEGCTVLSEHMSWGSLKMLFD